MASEWPLTHVRHDRTATASVIAIITGSLARRRHATEDAGTAGIPGNANGPAADGNMQINPASQSAENSS